MHFNRVLPLRRESCSPRQLPRPQQYGVEHLGCQDAGKGVLLGDVVATEKRDAVSFMLGPVPELGLRPYSVQAKGRVPGECSEAEDHLRVQDLQLTEGEWEAGVAFFGGWFVRRRGATDGGGDPDSREPEIIVLATRDRGVCKASAVKPGEQEIAGTVTREESSRPVGAVGRRGEAEYYDPGFRITEAWQGSTPVRLVAERCPFLAGNLLAPLYEAWAAAAGDYFFF